jgi:hypothetical protein
MIISPHITASNKLARAAYDAYWKDFKGHPTPFAKLTDEGQLKWQDVAKAVLTEANRIRGATKVQV